MQVIFCVVILWQKNNLNFEFIEGYSKRLKFFFFVDKWYLKSCFGLVLNRIVVLRGFVVRLLNIGSLQGFFMDIWKMEEVDINIILNYVRIEKDLE